MLHRALIVMAAIVSCSFVGCGVLPRTPAVPADLTERAELPGLEGIRVWGDTMSPQLERALVESWRLEIEAAGGDRTAVVSRDAHFLALSGGGSNGAFGAGLLCGWTERGDRPAFKVVTGISTGALIAPFAFVGPDYDHVLREVYTSVKTSDIATSRGLISGLTSDSLADTAPLRRMLDRLVDDKFLDRVAAEYRKGRLLIVGTTNLDAQRPVLWRLGALACTDHPDKRRIFIDALLASAAIPGAFPPVMIDVEADGKRFSEMHADGGVASQVFLYPAAFSFTQFARQHGAGERKRHAYVIRNARLDPEWQSIDRRTLPIAVRSIDTLIKTQGVGDLYRIYLGCDRDGIEFNLAAIPADFREESKDSFDPVYMKKLFDVGFDLGKSSKPWVHAPPGFAAPTVDEGLLTRDAAER